MMLIDIENIVAIDFESSSVRGVKSARPPEETSYPIEVGLAWPGGAVHSCLITPHASWVDWTQSAEKVHKIQRAQLFSQGSPIVEVANGLNEMLRGKNVICDGDLFDKFWNARLFEAAEMKCAYELTDLRDIADVYSPLFEWISQEVLGKNYSPVHRAGDDASNLLRLVSCYQRALAEQNIGHEYNPFDL